MANDKRQSDVSSDYGPQQMLDLISKQQDLTPQLLLAALSLTNLLGIVDYLNQMEDSSQATGTTGGGGDKQALANTLLSVLATEGSGDKKEALLTGLMGALGGGSGSKKLDPGALLSLATSLAGQKETATPQPAQYAADHQAPAKSQAEVRDINTRRG